MIMSFMEDVQVLTQLDLKKQLIIIRNKSNVKSKHHKYYKNAYHTVTEFDKDYIFKLDPLKQYFIDKNDYVGFIQNKYFKGRSFLSKIFSKTGNSP